MLNVLQSYMYFHEQEYINPLNAELNSICHLLALLGAHHILHVSGVRVNNLLPHKFSFMLTPSNESCTHKSVIFQAILSLLFQIFRK
jgi:hypothetical protein